MWIRPTKNHVTLFLVGAALCIAQFIMIRDFVAILYGEEVVIVLVTASFFLGLSAGYLLALRLSTRVFQTLFASSVFLHLSFPFSYRYLAAWFSEAGLDGYWFLGLLFLYALVFSTLFATFLPRLVSDAEDMGQSRVERMRVFYGLELVGFMCGFVVVGLSWNKPLVYLLVPYWLFLGALLYLVLELKPLVAAYGVVAASVVSFLTPLDSHSTALLYEHKHNIREPRVLYSVNSAYQKVEIIEDGDGDLLLYLDGLKNLNSGDLEGLNFYIADLPAALIKPENALLVGNGTLSSVPKVYPHAERLTSVELDAGVLDGGRRFFTPDEALQGLDRWQLVVDDGKHFMRKSKERYDLIVMDVPSPLTIQEAYLHTVEFYRLARDHLTDNGVIAVQLSGPLQRNNRTPARVTAALRQVFSEVMVIESKRAERGFAYAAMDLPFSAVDVRRESRRYEKGLKVVKPPHVDRYLQTAKPLTLDQMDLVLRRGWERFEKRYFHDD
jgi:spermidine synthase